MAFVKYQLTAPQVEDANGDPLVGGSITAYLWDKSTPTPMYTDSAGGGSATSFTLNTFGNPQTDAGTAVDIFLDTAITYKFIIRDSAGTQVGPTIGPVYPAGGTGQIAEFASLEEFRASSFSGSEAVILAANAGTTTGRMILKATGTSAGTTTLTAARFTALAGGEIINAGGYGFALDTEKHMISPYDFGMPASPVDAKSYFDLAAQAANVYGKNEFWGPPGTWTFGSVSTWAYSNLTLRGFGKTVSVLKIADSYADQSYLFDCLDVSDCNVIDIGFDGNMANQGIVDLTDNKQIGFRLRGTSSNWKFVRTLFKDWGKDGIYIASTAQNNIEIDSDFENIRRIGVTIIAGKNIKIRGHHKNGAASSNMIFNHAVHWEPNSVSETLFDLDVSVSCEDMQGGVVLYNSNGADQHNINIHDCRFKNITERSAIVAYSCGVNPVGIHNNHGYECGNTTSSSVMTDGGGITHENSVINATCNTWINCGGYLGTVANDGSSGRGSIYNSNVHLGDRRRAVYQGYVFGAGSTGSLRHIESNSFLGGGTDAANTYPAVEVKNTSSHNGSGDVVTDNAIQTSTTSGYSAGVVVDYDDATSTYARNRMVGNGVRYTFTNGTPGDAGDKASGSVTLSAAATRTVNNVNVLASSKIVLVPTNAAAATLMSGSKALYVSARTAGASFTLATADGTNAAGTETFDWYLN